ncbi:hypothetical protein KEM56_007749 [Ascosphaera pollenicola]|nr:hypothetical protein KEM56_007749 [Ascosphaera pollenicola]
MPQSRPGPGRAGSKGVGGASTTSDARSMPKKTARFTTSNLKSTGSAANRKNRFGPRTDDQTTLTQINFVRLDRPLCEIDRDELEEEVPGTVVHRDNHAEPDEGEPPSQPKRRKAASGRGIKRSSSAVIASGTGDDTLTQMGFVKPTLREWDIHAIEDDVMGISPSSRGRSKLCRSHGNDFGLQNRPAGRTESRDVETAESESQKRRRLSRDSGPAPRERSATPLLENVRETQEPGLCCTPQKNQEKASLPLCTPPSAVSTVDESPPTAKTPEKTIEQESPTKRRSTRNRRFWSSRTMTIENSPSSSGQSEVQNLQANAISLCSSSVQATQSPFNELAAREGARHHHTPDTSPSFTSFAPNDPSHPNHQVQKTRFKEEHRVPISQVQDTHGPGPMDERYIPDSQDEGEEHSVISSLDNTPPRQSGSQCQGWEENSTIVGRENVTQSQKTNLPHHRSNDSPTVIHEQQTQSQSHASRDAQPTAPTTTANQMPEPSLLYARRQQHVFFDPLSSEIREIDSDKLRQLFPSSPQRRAVQYSPQEGNGHDADEVATQSQSYQSASQRYRANKYHRVSSHDRNEEVASTEFVPDSSDVGCLQHCESGRYYKRIRPGESFPSSPPAVLVQSSQPNHIRQKPGDAKSSASEDESRE